MDPTKKELYTAKRPSGLDTSSPELATLVQAFRSDEDATNWLVFKVAGSSVAAHGSGSDGLVGLLDALNDEDVYYAALRCSIGGMVKFYHIYFVGENVGGLKKGKACLFKPAVFGLVDAHGEVSCVDGKDECTEQFVRGAISKLCAGELLC
ncbi:hypothetical protein B484DRAFT_451761 [Ochromonadaceae sp. CCMP2298]|nr:hypothetical protein B484DRAFT_451761 [Ochromonadaceae sp. CCMP2298]